MSDTMRLRGRCPACRNTTLFVGEGNLITCSWLECPDPGAVNKMLVTVNGLDYLAARVHAANKKWWVSLETGEPIQRNIGELLMLSVSELAEALEGHRKNLKDDKLPNRDMFHVEIVDCFIRLFDICGGLNIDLGAIFEEKMAFNAVRVDHTHEARKTDTGKKY